MDPPIKRLRLYTKLHPKHISQHTQIELCLKQSCLDLPVHLLHPAIPWSPPCCYMGKPASCRGYHCRTERSVTVHTRYCHCGVRNLSERATALRFNLCTGGWAMGLAGGIVRRVLSKSPCSSQAGGCGGHNERSPVDHKRRWSSLRLFYLCGDEISVTAAEDGEDNDDDGTVSAGSFKTCAMPQEAQVLVLADQRRSNVDGGGDKSNPEEPQDQIQGNHAVEDSMPMAGEEEAGTLIQSAFRGFRARTRLSSGQQGCSTEEPKSPASASIAASVEVQVGESLSNLRLSDDGTSLSAQHRASQKSRPQLFRAKEEWDDSTLSSNVLRMRIQSRIEATTRRERALAYAFSQQLRSCGGGTKKRSSLSEQGEFNVGWSWLERWMATRQAEPSADDCMSKNAADSGSVAAAGRRVIVVRRRQDVAVEEKESCGSNDVSAVSFDGSSTGGRSSLSCYRPGKNRLRGARNLPRRKVASSSDHRLQARSHKVSKKARQREEQQAVKDQIKFP